MQRPPLMDKCIKVARLDCYKQAPMAKKYIELASKKDLSENDAWLCGVLIKTLDVLIFKARFN